MAKFLTTAGIIYQVEGIIKEAKKKLVLISPYVQINKMLLERLQQASDRGVQIILIYGKDDLKKTEKNQLATIENLTLYFYQNLHAKCYFNEKEMVITSMNLYEFSERNNREMGILVTKIDNPDIFKEAVDETFSIIESVKKIDSGSKAKPVKFESIFPLKENDLKEIHDYFEKKHNNCTVNSSSTYVYCKELIPFGDVMIREGFEIRFHYNLYSENLLLNKLKNLNLNNLKYSYEFQITNEFSNNTKFTLISKNASDIKTLLEDYNKIYYRILTATKNVSHKTRPFM